MRVATWNLQRPTSPMTARGRRLIDWLQQVDADIWVLTETHESVRPGPDFRSVMTTGADPTGRPGERWAVIWSRFTIEPLPDTSDPVRAVSARIIPKRGAPLVVYATVLPWVGSSWRDVRAVGGEAFAAALNLQAQDWTALRAAHPDHDLILAGDFNQDLADSHFYGSHDNRRRLVEALQTTGVIPLTSGGGDPVRRDSPPLACIDHICITAMSRWRAGIAWRWPDLPTPDSRLSDHFGVAVDFTPV